MALLLPQGVAAAGQMGIPQQQAVNEPFVWGAGGERLTPEDIAMRRALGQQQAAAGADFSPATGGFLEALGRGGQGLLGGLQQRRAGEAADVNAAETDAVLQALMGEGVDNNALMSAMANPYVSDQVRQLAQFQFERANPKPQAPTEFERMLSASGVVQGSPEWAEAMRTAVANKLDPWTNLVVGGNSITGRQSAVQQALGGGGQTSTGGGNLPRVFDQESYDAVPAGQQYTTPSGEVRIKGGGSGNATGGF